MQPTAFDPALDRVYKLGVSLPDAPLTRFRARTAGLPQTTEAERLVVVPWSECDDAQRLDVHNGLLLSALWDAAFDTGLVSFANDGTVLTNLELRCRPNRARHRERASIAQPARRPPHQLSRPPRPLRPSVISSSLCPSDQASGVRSWPVSDYEEG
jgi:hypothetical protein